MVARIKEEGRAGQGRGRLESLVHCAGSVQCLSTVIASLRTRTGDAGCKGVMHTPTPTHGSARLDVIGLSAVMHTHADHLSTGLTFQSGKCKPSNPPRLACFSSLSLFVDTRSFAYRSLVVLARRTDKFSYIHIRSGRR